MKHSLERTSPKGGKFIGTCTLCGIPNLTIADSQNDCENVRGLSSDAALVEAVLGPSMPNPTPEMLASQEFEAVWQCIKSWDINVPEAYGGYCGANGGHVASILNALTAAKRQ